MIRIEEHVKCQFLGCNFRFNKIDESDVDSIMDIVNGELTHKKRAGNQHFP